MDLGTDSVPFSITIHRCGSITKKLAKKPRRKTQKEDRRRGTGMWTTILKKKLLEKNQEIKILKQQERRQSVTIKRLKASLASSKSEQHLSNEAAGNLKVSILRLTKYEATRMLHGVSCVVISPSSSITALQGVISHSPSRFLRRYRRQTCKNRTSILRFYSRIPDGRFVEVQEVNMMQTAPHIPEAVFLSVGQICNPT